MTDGDQGTVRWQKPALVWLIETSRPDYPVTTHNFLSPSGGPDCPAKLKLSEAGSERASRHCPVCQLGAEELWAAQRVWEIGTGRCSFCPFGPGLLLMSTKINVMSLPTHERGTLGEQAVRWSDDFQTKSGP